MYFVKQFPCYPQRRLADQSTVPATRPRPGLQSCEFARENLNLKRASGNSDGSAHHAVIVRTHRSASPNFSKVIGLLFAPAQGALNAPTSISLIRVCRAVGFYLAVHVIPTWRSRHFLSPHTGFSLIPTGDNLLSKLRANEKNATDIRPCCGQLSHCDTGRPLLRQIQGLSRVCVYGNWQLELSAPQVWKPFPACGVLNDHLRSGFLELAQNQWSIITVPQPRLTTRRPSP
jgi:hypothetical protein